jgi:hypothetical protein
MASGSEGGRDRWSAAALAVLALAYLAANRGYPLDTLAAPGPGVFPLATGLVLLVLAAGQFAMAGRRSSRGSAGEAGAASGPPGPGPAPAPLPARPVEPPDRRAVIALMAALVVHAATVQTVGFFTASFALVVVASRLMGVRGWWGPAALATGVCLASHVIFVAWLAVPLPAGLLR